MRGTISINPEHGRKASIDNLRTLTILMLFPFHIFMIYNNWGETFYVHGAGLAIPSLFNKINYLWMMPMLFVLAGMSSRYALLHRTAAQYVKERVNKLLIPLVFGMLLLAPIQLYLASMHYNGYARYIDYFIKSPDPAVYVYDFVLSPTHLWFLLFLFIISLVSLPFMMLYRNRGKGAWGGETKLVALIALGLVPCITGIDLFEFLEPGGKSPLEFLVFFLFGTFVLANDRVLERLERFRFLLLSLAVAGGALTMHFAYEFREMASWLAVLALLGLSRHYLGSSGKVSRYLSGVSFGLYLFHQPLIIIVGFFVLRLIDGAAWQIPIIFLITVPLTFAVTELCRRLPVTRWMFALKKPGSAQTP